MQNIAWVYIHNNFPYPRAETGSLKRYETLINKFYVSQCLVFVIVRVEFLFVVVALVKGLSHSSLHMLFVNCNSIIDFMGRMLGLSALVLFID